MRSGDRIVARRARGSLERDICAALASSDAAMTPAQVREALDGDLAYTTVMTVLTRLHDKGVVTRQPAGKGYVYSAIRDAAEVTARRMQRVLDADDDRTAALTHFVGTLSDDDERLLRSLLDSGESS